jgi:hypothetical protein
MVGDMVAAEEGRMRHVERTVQGHVQIAVPQPPVSPTAEFPDYISVDEALPAYECEEDSQTSSVVADGFRYSHGSSYTPSQDSDSGSDELGYTKP